MMIILTLSTNYGLSFTDISNSVVVSNKFSPAISGTGKYMYITKNPQTGGSVYVSKNYGGSWSVETGNFGRFYALSYSGKYILKCIKI